MANIRVTPETLNAQGGDLVKFAQDLSDILGSIDSKINEIIEGWDGLGQDAYYDMYTSMKKSLDEFPKLVDGLGQATIKTAGAFSDLDTQLQSGFKSGQ